MASWKRPRSANQDESSSSGHIEHLVVGDEPCTFVQVGDVLYRCASAGELWPKLIDIAKSLQVPIDRIISLETRIGTKITTYPGALFEILEAWRGKFSTEAKLQNLINVLERNCLADCADSLRIHFNEFDDAYVISTLEKLKSTAKSSTWKNLPNHLKLWMNCKPVKFQGNENKIEELTAQVATPVDDKILDELGARKTPRIVHDNVPARLDYYVHRTVTSRNTLKLDVLKEECKDVFVIDGMEKHQLSSLVPKNESTDVSGNQVARERLTVRFLLLQHKSDFDKICNIATTPVHWVKYKNGKLELVRSSGSAVNLQKHIHHYQDSFNENELTCRPERVIAIADSPGMGKTCLLANIAHQIMREKPTMLVRFIVLKEFVDVLRNKKINTESIVKQIAEQSSEYEFGKKLVENALKTECVLLFDGLDEVLSNQMPTAKKILQAAAELRSAKVFVATRPHLRDEIENTLHVLAYTMQPFNDSNQINFLAEFWKSKGATDNESLKQFTQKCVTQLSSKMKDSERSIAGIPLQCRMLGETYEAQAIRCSNVGYHSYVSADSVVMVDSIFRIYERHMELRFEKIRSQQGSRIAYLLSFFKQRNQYEIIKNVHMYFALELLFPFYAFKFKALNSSYIELHELCGLGILEATHSKDIRFVHRTFAEYLVAWFTYENVINSSPNGDLLLSTIFKLKPQRVYLYSPLRQSIYLESFEFDFSVICYFLNGFAKKYAPTTPVIHNEEVLMPFYIASACHNYESIPNIVTHSVAERYPIKSSELHMRDLFYIAARFSDLELMKIFCTRIDIAKINFMKIEKSNKHDTFILTPLHVAVMRVHYPLVEYLLKKFEHIASELRYLIHLCVSNSHNDSNSVVDDKIQIVKLLSKVNKKWVYEEVYNTSSYKDEYQKIPLTQDLVHLRLFECLLQEHDNLNTIDKHGNTLLHKITEKKGYRLTGESYHQIVDALSRHEFKLFNKPNKQQATPLHLAVKHIEELRSTTVEFFVYKGADLNAVDQYGNSVLIYAIRGKQSVELMEMMINLGAETKHTGKNALHISVEESNLNALEYFIEIHNFNVNDQDENGNTPLHLAVQWKLESLREDSEPIMMLLMEFGANVNAENNRHNNPLMHAFECGKLLSLTVIKEMEKHGLNITKAVATKALTAIFLYLEIDSYIESTRTWKARVPLNIFEHFMDKNEVTSLYKLKTRIKSEHLEKISASQSKKGGQVDFEFTDNFWKWEVVQKAMPRIIQHTYITSELLAKSKQHGILTEHDCMELESLDNSVKSSRFYEIMQNKSGSFERVYLIMRGHEDLSFAVEELFACLKAAREKLHKQIFVKRNTRVNELIDSNVNVIALVTNDLLEFSVKRIQDTTLDENVQVVKEHELEKTSTGRQNNLVVLKCDTLTTELVNKLLSLNLTCLCVCKQTYNGVEGCEIVTETHSWADVSRYFRNKLWVRVDGNLYNFTQLFATPNILGQLWQRDVKLNNCNKPTILKLVNYKIVHEQSTYLSPEVFSHFLPDKLVFVNINEQDLKMYAKYGQEIGDPSQDIKSLDYVILPESGMHLFDNICRQANSNVHLIEHDKGRFKILRTCGTQEAVAKFFNTTSCDFPFCNCPTSRKLFMSFRVYYGFLYNKLVKCELDEVLPKGRRVFGVQEQVDLLELRGLLQQLDVPKPCRWYFNHQLTILKEESESKRYWKHIPEIICKLVEHVGNGEQHKNLQQMAVNTIYPNFAKIVQSTSCGVEKYMQLELLEYRKEYLVFKHEVLATYLIAEMIIVDNLFGNESFHEIFKNCFDIAHMNPISFCLGDYSEYRPKTMATYKFREPRLFKYLDFLATKYKHNAISSALTKVVSPQSHAKWIHSIVNDNLVNLFEVFMKLGFDDLNTFESEDLVVLAVAHGDLSLVELVTQQYKKYTNNQLNRIKIPLLYYYNFDRYHFECFISVLDVAALKSHYDVFEYFSRTIAQPQMEHLAYHCVVDTLENSQVDDLKRIITFLNDNQPSLFQNQFYHHPLLAPSIHVDLIIHLINLGVNVHATKELKRNILYLCTKYLTPEEYHRVVNALVERQETELFHSRDSLQITPLHIAVEHLELLDTTIQLFSSAKVNFNAVGKYKGTALNCAVFAQRSARILDSLIKAGADENARGYVNRTVLHVAAEYGNLTALKYFILRGHNVNVTDEKGCTPLHLALGLSKTNTHEVVVLLVEHGADVNAIDKFGKTPLFYANRSESEVEARTKEYLEIAKMESLLTKWESEIMQHNIDKLSALTNFESELLQKLILNGIFIQRDIEDLESIERVSLRGNKLYVMLLAKKPDFKILLNAFSDSNNVGVLSVLVKELTNYMYNALMNLEVKVVNYAMHTKGYADFLNLFVQAFQETDRQTYADKLSIVQLLCTLSPNVLPPKRSEIYTSLQIAFLSKHDKKLEFIKNIITHVNQPEILDFVYLCLAHTRYKYSDVNERKLIITNIFQNHPALFQNPQNCYLLLAPNIHVDLIIHLINLDVDVNVTNEKKKNILHLCAGYLTPEEYHRVVNALVEKHETELFHSRDEDEHTPLHVAVRHLELLDSTIQLFSSAKVEFNAVDKDNDTALHVALRFKQSARILDSLIKAGADEKARGEVNRTVLHLAAESGNLTALKYFILRGHDVNVTDENGFTPLHVAVKFSRTNTHDLVVLLVEHGADVNAINKDGETPLDIANDSYFGVASFTKFPRKRVAKSYESIRETLLEETHSKWQSEVINSNLEKLTVLTKCDSTWLQKLKSTGTSVNVDELIGNDSPDAKDFYSMLLAKKYDLKMILKLLHDTNNTEAVILLTKEVISTLYDALLNRKYSFVHFVMQIKGVYEDLQPLLNAMELIDRHQYTDKLYIIQLIGLLDPQFLKYRRSEILSPMQLALHSRNEKQFELIQLLISHNVDLNERDRKGLTPLNYAVQQKPVPPRVIEIVKLLIENGADPDAKDEHGYTFLHWAPYFLTPELYDQLIVFFDSSGRKNSLKLLTPHKHSHLHLAVYNFEALMNTLDVFKSNGVDFNGQDKDGVSVVFLGIEGGRDADFLRTLFTYGADWRITDNSNSNSLHTASFFGNVSALKLFIELGCDVNSKNIDGHTPLHNAFLGEKDGEEMTEHEIEIVKLLIENGADPDAVDQQGRTFLHNAPYFLTSELYDQLIMFFDSSGRKDSLKVRDFHNWSHLHHAVANFDPLPSTLNKFKSNGINFNGQDNDGDSVVFDAIEGGRNAEFLRTLFKYGADWRIPNKNKENALHLAALYGNVSALKLFIELGCDVSARNTHGRTPLHNAFLGEKNSEDMKEHEIVVILLKERVDVTVKDTQGKTAIELAKERLITGKVKQETVKILEKYSLKSYF